MMMDMIRAAGVGEEIGIYGSLNVLGLRHVAVGTAFIFMALIWLT